MSKFWDKLSKEHQEKLLILGVFHFRDSIAHQYSSAEKNDTEEWIRKNWIKAAEMGVDFDEGDKMIGGGFSIEGIVNYQTVKISQDLIHSRYEVFALKGILPKVKTILEIGAGSGRTAEAIKCFYPNIGYEIIDIEPAAGIAKWYLEQAGVTGVYIFLPTTQKKMHSDLTLAISTLSELDAQEVVDYWKKIDSKYVYIKDWEHWEDTRHVPVDRSHYQIPKEWEVIFDRPYPFCDGFFEALYKTK